MKLIEDIRDAWQLDQEPKRELLAIEKITIGYAALTLFLIFIFWGNMLHPAQLLVERMMILLGIGALYVLHRRFPSEGTRFLRNLFPLTLLSYWYPDTYEFCQLFPNVDYLFACQPSIEFSRLLHGKFWSELFYMGYFSYFPMIVITIFVSLLRSRRLFEKTAFIVMASFFLYYIIFLFLPVAGPQFYFPAAGVSNILNGHYPMLDDYFRTHAELVPHGGFDGFFRSLVDLMHMGERPTAAFPSSHVGAGIIIMILLFRHNRKIFISFIPFFVLLCCSTVYIQAHYLVDVLGGFATAAVFYPFTHWLYGVLHTKDYHRHSKHGHNGSHSSHHSHHSHHSH